jgi:hypothetical protein
VYYRDKKVVGVFVRFRAPLQGGTLESMNATHWSTQEEIIKCNR